VIFPKCPNIKEKKKKNKIGVAVAPFWPIEDSKPPPLWPLDYYAIA
jgi:hypothetical protein